MFDDDVWRYLPLGPAPTLVLAAVGAVAAVYAAVVRSRRSRGMAVVMLVASVLVILAVTARGALAIDGGGFSWHLGASVRDEWGNVNRSLGVVNIVGNVVMFVPIGWLVGVLAARRPILTGTLAALALSVSVEVWQMISGSFGDIDDVVLNGLGGLLGAVAATLLRSLRTSSADHDSSGPKVVLKPIQRR